MAFLLPYKLPLYRQNTIIAHETIQGVDLGIPLNMIANLFTNLHYNYDITKPYMITLQFLIGYYTYGKDRYKDALDYEITPFETTKKDTYMTLLKYRHIYQLSYCVSFYLICFILAQHLPFEQLIPVYSLLYSTEYYKVLKDKIPLAKPFYVAILWTFATCILPCVLYEQNYRILSDPLDYLPCGLNLFALTNLADINDMEEDTVNGVKTLPVLLGEDITYSCVFIALASSSLFFGIHPNYYERPYINSLFEIQNIMISCLCAYSKFKS